MSAKTDKCSDNNKSVCDYNDFSRLRFFQGMLLDDKDFRAEQQYHANKRRFLNRMLHGSGVVCGLELHGEVEKRTLEVTRGFALDCSGNEIWVPQNVSIDLCSILQASKNGKAGECVEPTEEKPKQLCIGIRYQERETNPVSVYLPSGSCEEKSCENSRIKEGYCIEVVDCCVPNTRKDGVLQKVCECEKPGVNAKFGPPKQICHKCNSEPKPGENRGEWCRCVIIEDFCEQSPKCAECCCSDHPCFVVLGRIQVDEKCQLVSICNNECRQYVITPGLIKHMLVGGFSGFEDFLFDSEGKPLDPKLPTAVEIADNPIKGLCWLLNYLAQDKAKPQYKYCGEKSETKQEPTGDVKALYTQVNYMKEQIPAELEKLNRQIEKLNRQFIKLNQDVNDVRVDSLNREAADKKSKKG